MSARFFAFDTETTGLDPTNAEIISIAMLLLDGSLNELSRKVVFALPEGPVDPKAAAVNGYTKEKWLDKGAVTQDVLFKEVQSFLFGQRDLLPLGHNVSFDVGFLQALFAKHGAKISEFLSYHKVDTVGIAIYYDLVTHGTVGSYYRLTELTSRFEIPHDNAHDALSDVVSCVELFRIMHKTLGGKTTAPPPVTHSRLLLKNASNDWVFRGGKHKDKTVTQLVQEKPDYLSWVMQNVTDLSDEQREHIKNALASV